jgi:hypothetical protein
MIIIVLVVAVVAARNKCKRLIENYTLCVSTYFVK